MTLHAYVPIVSATGLLVVGHCISTISREPLPIEWLVLATLTLLTGSFTIKVPSQEARLSVSETFVFMSVMWFGVCAGTLTVALDILVVIAAGTRSKARDPLRVLFNVSSASLSIWLAGHVFYQLAGVSPLMGHSANLQTLLLPVFALSSIYFLLNSGMVAVALALQRQESAFQIWRTNFLGLSINYFGGASVAALVVAYTKTVDWMALAIIIPLLVISYLTFKMSLGRLEDATKHIEEVSRLYLSTIETLATAIDAKDQVTHGHIRRVQRFALGLARSIGMTDGNQLKALEAAALLHDTGKLVVPEHILNKPARLTRAEFEKMKLHASVGADILSSIRFPYPVVPIVRHHHENWDGTGYPDGLRGTEIPLGARILAVVDCFDALTSDRPYRRRLPDDEALKVLVQRRGSMYDPLVVDTFIRVKDELAASLLLNDAQSGLESLLQQPRTTSRVLTRRDHCLASQASESAQKMLDTTKTGSGSALVVLMLKDTTSDELSVAAHAGKATGLEEIASIGLGTRVSGWVAANGRSIVNADAVLDMPNANSFGLFCCTSVPIELDGHIIGALTAYSEDRSGLAPTAVAALEGASKALAAELRPQLERLFSFGRNESKSQTIH